MLYRAAVLALTVISFNIFSFAQRGNFGTPTRPGLPQSQQEMFNSLTGTVVGLDGKGLKDVHVELRDGNGSTVSSVYTNTSGNFEFPPVGSGTYQIIATSGLEQVQDQIQVQRMPGSISLRLPVRSTPDDGGPTNSVSVAQYRIPPKAREEFKKAEEATSKGKGDDAEKHLAKALEIYPKYADAITLRAIFRMDKNDQPGAIADLQQAINYDENCAMAYLVMGAVLNRESKFDDAIRSLQRGEALAPNSWQAYFEMGKALIGKMQYEAAVRQLDRAQTLVPKEYPLIHLVKAHAMLAMNNYIDAMTELRAYLEKEPQGPNSAQAQKMLEQAKAFAAKSAK